MGQYNGNRLSHSLRLTLVLKRESRELIFASDSD